MKIFTCTDFSGFYPVGVSAVIIAESVERAAILLIEKLNSIGLTVNNFTLVEVDTTTEGAKILQDGNY